MTEAACPICGWEFPIPEGEGSEEIVVVICQECGSQLQVSIRPDVGVETLSHAESPFKKLADESETKEVDEGAGGATTVSVGTGTLLLDLEKSPSATPRRKTVAQGSLILAGALPGNEPLRLTEAKTVVGRESADIVIDDPALSSRHFEIEARGSEFFIRDLDSSNGTFLNGRKIRASQLTSSDKIQAGETKFTFIVLEYLPLDRSK